MNNFQGIFKEELLKFQEYKITNGFKYNNTPRYLLSNFDKYTIEKNIKEKKLTKELIVNYLNSKINICDRTKNEYASILRQFGIYLRMQDIEAYVLPEKYFTSKYNFHPYIYTEEEIKKIFKAISDGFLKIKPKKQEQVRLIVLLLFKTGMRIGEILTIKRSNIDYNKKTILLENTKNETDRIILVDDKMISELKEYELKHNKKYEYYFENNSNNLYSVGCFNNIFRKLLYKAKIMHTEDGPRVHDARHTFCVNSLKQAIENNYDLNNFIPILSAYVGHKDLGSTYKYLHLTSEIFPDIRKKAKEIIKLEKDGINYEEF